MLGFPVVSWCLFLRLCVYRMLLLLISTRPRVCLCLSVCCRTCCFARSHICYAHMMCCTPLYARSVVVMRECAVAVVAGSESRDRRLMGLQLVGGWIHCLLAREATGAHIHALHGCACPSPVLQCVCAGMCGGSPKFALFLPAHMDGCMRGMPLVPSSVARARCLGLHNTLAMIYGAIDKGFPLDVADVIGQVVGAGLLLVVLGMPCPAAHRAASFKPYMGLVWTQHNKRTCGY